MSLNTVRIAGIVCALAMVAIGALGGGAGAASAQEGGCTLTEEGCALTVTKTLTSANPAATGGAVTYAVTVKNTGDVTLTDVNLTDVYEQANLDFVGANPAPTSLDEDLGILNWDMLLPDPDAGGEELWDPGDARTLTMSFTAKALPGAENCAVAVAFAPQQETDVSSDIACVDVRFTSGGGGGGSRGERDKTATPATGPEPADTPAPVSTVAAATRVPAKTPSTGIVAPDTGTGGGTAGGAADLLLLAIAAVIIAGAGATLVKIGNRR